MLPVICLDAYFEHCNLNLHEKWRRKTLSSGWKRAISIVQKDSLKVVVSRKESKTHFEKKGEPFISCLTFQCFPMVRMHSPRRCRWRAPSGNFGTSSAKFCFLCFCAFWNVEKCVSRENGEHALDHFSWSYRIWNQFLKWRQRHLVTGHFFGRKNVEKIYVACNLPRCTFWAFQSESPCKVTQKNVVIRLKRAISIVQKDSLKVVVSRKESKKHFFLKRRKMRFARKWGTRPRSFFLIL